MYLLFEIISLWSQKPIYLSKIIKEWNKWFWLQTQTSENDLIPYSDTFHCYRLILYKLILKRRVMVILKLFKGELFRKYKMLIIRELKEHISSLLKILVSQAKAKEICPIKCWNNVWKSCETKTTTQSKLNASIYLYNENDSRWIEDTIFFLTVVFLSEGTLCGLYST